MNIVEVRNENKVVIKAHKSIQIISLENVIYIEADINYSKVVFSNRGPILLAHTLKSIELTLKNSGFIRCHKSYLVNLSFIEEVDWTDQYLVRLITKEELPVSRDGLRRMKAEFYL